MDSRTFIGGFLAGTAAGVAIGILLSSTDEETRKKLFKGAKKVTRSFADQTRNTVEGMTDENETADYTKKRSESEEV
jgi:gas vesicle protein